MTKDKNLWKKLKKLKCIFKKVKLSNLPGSIKTMVIYLSEHEDFRFTHPVLVLRCLCGLKMLEG